MIIDNVGSLDRNFRFINASMILAMGRGSEDASKNYYLQSGNLNDGYVFLSDVGYTDETATIRLFGNELIYCELYKWQKSPSGINTRYRSNIYVIREDLPPTTEIPKELQNTKWIIGDDNLIFNTNNIQLIVFDKKGNPTTYNNVCLFTFKNELYISIYQTIRRLEIDIDNGTGKAYFPFYNDSSSTKLTLIEKF